MRASTLILFLVVFAPINLNAEKLRCGLIATLTGGHAPIGTAIKNSIILAQKKFSSDAKVEFFFEDDAFLPKNTVLAANKLIATNKVGCLIIFGSSTSLAVADLVERAQIPTIAIAVSSKMTEGRRFVFREYIPVERQAELIVSQAKARGYEKIAMITTIQDATVTLREKVSEKFSKNLVLDEQVPPEDIDLRSIAARVVAQKADSVFLNVLPPQLSNLSKQLRSLGFKGEFFAGPPLGNLDEVKAAKGALDGAWFVSVDDEKAAAYYDDYKASFGENPAVEGIYGYDLVAVLSSKPDSLNLADFLRGLSNFSGLLGTYSVKNNSFDIPAGLWRVENSTLLGPRARSQNNVE